MSDEINWVQWAFKGCVGGAAIGFTGWGRWLMNLVKDNSKDIGILDDKIRDNERDAIKAYVSRQDFRDTVTEIKETNKRIYERIDLILEKLGNHR